MSKKESDKADGAPSRTEVDDMEFRMTVEMDNAAFEDAPGSELCRLLTILDSTIKREGARSLAHGGVKLRDSNGNTVGVAKVVRD